MIDIVFYIYAASIILNLSFAIWNVHSIYKNKKALKGINAIWDQVEALGACQVEVSRDPEGMRKVIMYNVIDAKVTH